MRRSRYVMSNLRYSSEAKRVKNVLGIPESENVRGGSREELELFRSPAELAVEGEYCSDKGNLGTSGFLGTYAIPGNESAPRSCIRVFD